MNDSIFVPKNLAKALKDLDFNEPCFKYYNINSGIVHIRVSCTNSKFEEINRKSHVSLPEFVTLPTYDQVIGWFRIVHRIHVTADLLPNLKQYSPTFVPLYFTPKKCENAKEFYERRRQYSIGEQYFTCDGFENYYDALNLAIEKATELVQKNLSTKGMTKSEAITLAKLGKKITHTNFLLGEWFIYDGETVVTEDGTTMDSTEYWKLRENESWNNGYRDYLKIKI